MAWSYDDSLSSDKDFVRFLIGDTNSTRQLVADETIEAIILTEPNNYMAAAAIIESLYRGLTAGGSLEDRKVGETRIRYQRISDLMLQVNSLRKRGGTHMRPSAGGIYTADKTTADADTSLNKAEIEKHMLNNPRGPGSITNEST